MAPRVVEANRAPNPKLGRRLFNMVTGSIWLRRLMALTNRPAGNRSDWYKANRLPLYRNSVGAG
jgi:hypothetical protein